MKLIGYWIRSLSDDHYPPPQELVIAYDSSTRKLLADYLDAGATFAVYRGCSWCRFFCGHRMGNAELTDGEWVWPQDLSHYVRDHSVRLPDEFIACARSKPVAAGPLDENLLNVSPDDSFWISWCNAHRSNSLKARIQIARSQADAEAQQIKADAIADRERSEGLSDNLCQWAGCNNRALVGRRLCASCILKPEWSSLLSRPYMNLRAAIDG